MSFLGLINCTKKIARKATKARWGIRSGGKKNLRSGPVLLARSKGASMGRAHRDFVVEGVVEIGPRTDFFALEEPTSEH